VIVDEGVAFEVGLVVGFGLQEHASVTTKMTKDIFLIKGLDIGF
jgi:hypothetical protein